MNELPTDYTSLLQEYLSLKKDLENQNQDFYDCRRQLKVSEALQLEYQSEIELLQRDQNAGIQKHKLKITQLEEELVKSRASYTANLSSLEQHLQQKEEECSELKADIQLLKRTNVSHAPSEDNNKLVDEIIKLKSENEELLYITDELKTTLENAQKNCHVLEEKLESLQTETDNLKESLQCKREELIEANDLVQQLNDDVLCLKNEIETLKSAPLDKKSQGNSLFAEVDDRRVHLQNKISTMKTDYLDMKGDRKRLLAEINKLRGDKNVLCERLEEEMSGKKEDECMLIKSLRSQVSTLTDVIEQYKKDLSDQLVSKVTCSDMNYADTLIKNKTLKIETLRNELTSRALTNTFLTESLVAANKETRSWRLKATKLKVELDILRNKIQDLNSNKTTLKMINREIEVSVRKIDEEEEVKSTEKEENKNAAERKPRFALGGIIKEKNVYFETKPQTFFSLATNRSFNLFNLNDIKVSNEKSLEEEVLLPNNEDCIDISSESDIIEKVCCEKPANISKEDNEANKSVVEVKTDEVIPLISEEVEEAEDCIVICDTSADDNKENATKENVQVVEETTLLQKPSGIPKKTVSFSENTVDSKVTNKVLLRKGGKIVKCPPPVFFKS